MLRIVFLPPPPPSVEEGGQEHNKGKVSHDEEGHRDTKEGKKEGRTGGAQSPSQMTPRPVVRKRTPE